MPSTLDFHRAVTLLAARLGLLASTLRGAASMRRASGQTRVAQNSHPQWQQQVHEIQESLRQAWSTQVPMALSTGYQDGTLPARIRGIYEHVSAIPLLSLGHSVEPKNLHDVQLIFRVCSEVPSMRGITIVWKKS